MVMKKSLETFVQVTNFVIGALAVWFVVMKAMESKKCYENTIKMKLSKAIFAAYII